MRTAITLACTECKQRNYRTNKNKKNNPDRLELKKYCPFCKKETLHKDKKKNPGKSFLSGVKVEMKKVIWPTKKELINYTVMVIVATIVVMVIIGVADGVFSQLFKLLQLVVG